MAKKVLSVRVDEKTIDILNYFCGTQGISQADFVTEAIEKHCDEIRHARGGGATAKIPNPNRFLYTEDEAKEVCALLNETAHKLNKICPSLNFGINEIMTFAHQRIFTDSEELRQEFSANFYNDLENIKRIKENN